MSLSLEMFNPKGLYLERVGQEARECRYIHFRKPLNKIGRSSTMDVYFNTMKANTVSREHSIVEFKNDRMYITNLSKTNPTFLNNDKVIRQTEVEEGDLIGFGSKPNIVYPHFSEDQIFIYECKSLNKSSKQQKVIILDDSEDDSDEEDEIEIIDENDNDIQIAPTIFEMKNEDHDLETKISEVEIVIETPPNKPAMKIVEDHPKISIEPPNTAVEPTKIVSSDISLHIDTVESINDLRHSYSDEDSSENVIKTENMLNVKIVVKKLTDEEMTHWRPKIEKEISESESESQKSSDEQNEIEEKSKTLPERKKSEDKLKIESLDKKVSPERRDSEKDKFFYNGQHFSKSKYDYLTKSMEMRAKIRSLVDDDDSDNGLFSDLPQKTKDSELIKKPFTNRSDSVDKSQKHISSYKRRMSTSEKDSQSNSKKFKSDELVKTSTKMYKFPGTETIISNNASKLKDKNSLTRRSSLSEVKNDTDSSDSMHKASNVSKKMFKRRMSLCPTSQLKIISPHNSSPSLKKKKLPPRRQTISESRYTEIDMFKKASELRMKKYGPTGKPSDSSQTKKLEANSVTKKQQIRDEVRVDKNAVNKEVKKILDPILNRTEPKISTLNSNKVVPPNNENKQESNTLDDVKKASLVKVKFTPHTRGLCLAEEIPLARKPNVRRLSSMNDQQPSTSKDAMPVAAFYNKYVKPNDILPNTDKTPSIDPIPEEVIDSLNAQINNEMKKQHEQLAVETTLTINDQESPSESNSDNELNLDTDDDLDKYEDGVGFYTVINTSTPSNANPDSHIDPDFGSPMKDDPRGKTKWVTSQNEDEQVERTFELQKFPSTPFLTTTIHVHHEKPVDDIKKILKTPPLYVSPLKQLKKRVSFNEYNLVNIVRYGIDDSPINTFKQQVAHVPPMRSQVRNPKYYESAACAELLEWDWKWITYNSELPDGWKVESHKHTYKSLQEYKNELKVVMQVELLKKLSTKYKSIAAKDKTWNFMTVKERKDDQNNHIKLVLGCDSKDMKQGTMLLLKVRDTNSITRKPIDINFFGYVTAVNDRGELKLDTYCKELRKEKAVLKSTSLIHLRSDIKLFAVLNCIQETPFMKLFLNPSLNKMERYEGMTSVSLEFKMTSMRLCPEQRTIIKKLSYELTKTKNETEKIMFINGGAGTGKTYMMLAAVLNLKICLKDKRRYLICASTLSGIDEIAETLYNMPHSSALNIVRIGYREQLIGSGRKLGINEQVQQKLNNGVKGKSYKEIQKEIIENADIILSTMKSCYDLFDYQLSIDACFIDEANFAIDAELMTLVQLNIKKMVFVGDEYQLEPSQSLVYKETRCNNSYFNRIINYYKSINFTNAPVFTLLTQHRMNKDLFYICNKHVYNDSMTYNSINSVSTANFPFKPFAVFTLDVTPNDQKLIADEINFFCMKLCEILPKNVSIGIVNGFPSQRDKSRVKLDTNDRRIECLAVETMQGIEKDVIILTLRNTETYFMHNFNRINVALTRARKALYICSNMNMILYPNEAGLFLRLKDDARNRDLYHVIQKFDFDRLYSMLRK